MEKDCGDDYFIIPSVCTYREFLDKSLDDSTADKFFERMRNEMNIPKKEDCEQKNKVPLSKASNSGKENSQGLIPQRRNSSSLTRTTTTQSVSGSSKLSYSFKQNPLSKVEAQSKPKIELPSRRSARIIPQPEINKQTPILASALPTRGRSVGPVFSKTNSASSSDSRLGGRRISTLLPTSGSIKPPVVVAPPKVPTLVSRAKRAASEPPKPDRSSRTVYNLRQTIQKPEKYEPPQISRTPLASSSRRSVSREPPRLTQRRANSVGPSSERRPLLPSQKLGSSNPPSTPSKVKVVTREAIMAMVERLSQPKKKSTYPH
uniref:Flocculation protein FLO11-like n=1 Tax=Parastrongyloides trichosuri TaxID=131310 RepID=A0A0N4Z259_PARTI